MGMHRQNYHVSHVLNRCARALIGSLVLLVVVLSVSAGSAWSEYDMAADQTSVHTIASQDMD